MWQSSWGFFNHHSHHCGSPHRWGAQNITPSRPDGAPTAVGRVAGLASAAPLEHIVLRRGKPNRKSPMLIEWYPIVDILETIPA